MEKKAFPVHVGIIMDGNGRWAKKRGLPRQAGHAAGAQVFRKITKYCEKIGIQYLTVYAFSTENWSRPKEEVDAIMDLLRQYLKESLKDFQAENIRTRFIGDFAPLEPDIRQLMREAEESTCHKTGMTLNIAINYGGRPEIAQAARSLAEEVRDGRLRPEDITETLLSQRMYPRWDAESGRDPAARRGIPYLQFSALAIGLCGICVYGGDPLAGFHHG